MRRLTDRGMRPHVPIGDDAGITIIETAIATTHQSDPPDSGGTMLHYDRNLVNTVYGQPGAPVLSAFSWKRF